MRTVVLFVCVVGLASAAHAGRALEEPPSFAKATKGAAKADLEKALAAVSLADRCKDGMSDPGILGLECRAATAVALARAKPLEKKADVDARVALFADLTKAAAQISSWEPLTPPPGLGRARFDAHREVSRGLIGIYDDLGNATAGEARAAATLFLKGTPDPKKGACDAAARTVELATGADASLEERGAAQSILTSHSCFLDESRLKSEPKPGRALAESKDAASVAAATSATGAILEYATSRKLDLQRCIDKHIKPSGVADDAGKLEQCVCGAVGRWKFPAPHQDTDTLIALSNALALRVSIAGNGSVHTCGPVVAKNEP